METGVNMSETVIAAPKAEEVSIADQVKQVITVTLNPAFDRAVKLDGFEEERVNRVLSERVDPGGKGVNVSRVLTAFGIPNTAVILAGQDNVAAFRRQLQQEKVRAAFLPIDGCIRENNTFTLPDGRVFKVDKAGTRVGSQVLLQVEHAISEQLVDAASTVVVFAGSLPPGLEAGAFADFLRSLQANLHVRIALDTQSLDAAQIVNARPWVIKPNIHELRAMTGRELNERREIVAAAMSLIRQGIGNVMVSMGADGLLVVDRKQAVQVTPPKVEALSTVGAGDSTLAGFLFAKHRGLSNEHAAPIAATFGTASVLVEGTAPPRKDAVSKLLKQMFVSRMKLG